MGFYQVIVLRVVEMTQTRQWHVSCQNRRSYHVRERGSEFPEIREDLYNPGRSED